MARGFNFYGWRYGVTDIHVHVHVCTAHFHTHTYTLFYNELPKNQAKKNEGIFL